MRSIGRARETNESPVEFVLMNPLMLLKFLEYFSYSKYNPYLYYIKIFRNNMIQTSGKGTQKSISIGNCGIPIYHLQPFFENSFIIIKKKSDFKF